MKKDFDEYFTQVEAQYFDCISELNDMEKEMSQDLVSPDTYEQFREMVKPLKNNYEILSFVKWLLDRPCKKEKTWKWEIQARNKKLLKASKTKQQVLDENNQVLNNLKRWREDD